ncbi:hypothetical protein EPUL_004872 [Erysiphe pulchra]|uniref:Endonuclease/exonuclease/phosphatase domain-containing protein n=1 Tax=Erysiphe pulchra TaxID=225359 RepID=A0A2S4PR69_9PEZI|nr:hypothetical protein EPUL_004872 [Erysiphe pulchra]
MADTDSDVDMSPPTTPTRASSVLCPPRLPLPKDHESRETLYSPGDPFISSDINPSNKINGSISKFTEGVFDDARVDISEHEATSCVQKLGLGRDTSPLERAHASVIKRYAHGEDLDRNENEQMGLSQSIYATSQVTAKGKKPFYTKTYLPRISGANLPQKPSKPLPNHITRTRKIDNRIFVRLPENRPSRTHHVHAVKAALVNKLGHEGALVKTVQKFNSGLVIFPADEKQAEQILKNSQVITSVLGGRVEKADESAINHWLITHKGRMVQENYVKSTTSGTIVAHFKQATNPFRLFGTSSMARLIIRSPKPTQCPKCWAFHDTRLYNSEQKCKQCGTSGHSNCQATLRCLNCKGPHAASETHCPARLNVKFGNVTRLSQVQLKRIRQVGHRAWLLVNPPRKDIEIANTARGQANHDLALALANSESADVILIQESWIFSQRDKKITKQHANYMSFCPVDTWETRPQVMTYVRKGTNLQPTQIKPSNTADICWIKILGASLKTNIVNVYRPPQEPEGGPTITALKNWKVLPNSLIAGDFNTRHSLWDSRSRDSTRAEELIDYTHNKGNVLDLVFTNIIGTQCNIEEHLHTTSDREILLTTLPLNGYAAKALEERFTLTSDAIPRFILGIKETLKSDKILLQDLDSLALTITESIKINMGRFLPRKSHQMQGKKWWNPDCREKAYVYRRARKLGDANTEKHALRNATRSMKKAYWQNIVQSTKFPSDIFKITRWHKNIATFSSPPIKHEGQIYEDPIDKALVLTKALLQRRTIDDDISEGDIPTEHQIRIQLQDNID